VLLNALDVCSGGGCHRPKLAVSRDDGTAATASRFLDDLRSALASPSRFTAQTVNDIIRLDNVSNRFSDRPPLLPPRLNAVAWLAAGDQPVESVGIAPVGEGHAMVDL
jgi:hypothetical protein